MLIDAGVRHRLTLVTLFISIVILVLSSGTIANAAGDSRDNASNGSASGQTIEAKVSASEVKGGSPGAGGGESMTVPVLPPCWMTPGETGKEYFAYVASGGIGRVNHEIAFMDGDSITAEPGYETHKDDDLGHWYSSTCDIANWPDQNDVAGFEKFRDQFWAENPAKYYAATDVQPTPAVPPELLREVAIKRLRLPDPELDWNPKIKGNDSTLVNFETWFWLDNTPPQTLSVRAEALDSWATVTATFGGIEITAPSEKPLPCPGSGTAYVTGAQTTDCSLTFSRSSASLGTQASGIPGAERTPVTVTSKWTATWEGTGIKPTPIILPTQPDRTVDIRVNEVQTLVTSAG